MNSHGDSSREIRHGKTCRNNISRGVGNVHQGKLYSSSLSRVIVVSTLTSLLDDLDQ